MVMLVLAGATVAQERGFHERFRQKTGAWHVADYEFSHPHFDTDWRKARVVFGDGLTLKLGPQVRGRGRNRFAGGSVRRTAPTRYGLYEAVIRPARGPGVITGFFYYTGPYYGTRHDEIDIEFLGRDTRRLHIAWFVDGKRNSRFVDLDFDAADRPRRYAFLWQPDNIRWYVEDRMIFEHTSAHGAVPSVPGRLFANIWAADPSVAAWAGSAVPQTRATARVTEVTFRPLHEFLAERQPGAR